MTFIEFGFGIDLTSHSLLRKIILTKRINLRELIGGNWATTSQVWFDPNQFWTPFTLENVHGVEICVHHIPENYGMERIGEVMPNIETLYLLGKVNDKVYVFFFIGEKGRAVILIQILRPRFVKSIQKVKT